MMAQGPALPKFVPVATVYFLLSVNVLSNSVSADLSFYYCVYSVLSQLSSIVRSNGDSHESSMYHTVLTCILEV